MPWLITCDNPETTITVEKGLVYQRLLASDGRLIAEIKDDKFKNSLRLILGENTCCMEGQHKLSDIDIPDKYFGGRREITPHHEKFTLHCLFPDRCNPSTTVIVKFEHVSILVSTDIKEETTTRFLAVV